MEKGCKKFEIEISMGKNTRHIYQYLLHFLCIYIHIYFHSLLITYKKITEKFGKLIIQSYYAAVSYIDNMIGKLIQQLHISMVRTNTVVILTSDHGTFNTVK